MPQRRRIASSQSEEHVELFFQQLLNGLTIGGVYSLVALGLTLVYGILHVPNFAHGAFYMTGAFAGYYLMAKLGVNYWLSMAGAAAIVAVIAMLAAAGWCSIRCATRPSCTT